MRLFNECVFSEYMTTANQNAYTDPRFDWLLGSAETFAMLAVIDQVSGTGTLQLKGFIEHSADRRNWTTKNSGSDFAVTVTAHAGSQSIVGTDAGGHIGLGYVRIKMLWVSGTSPAARVQLYCTGRAEDLYKDSVANW